MCTEMTAEVNITQH